MQRKTKIIAEIGENHLGNMDMAKAMVATAASSGADIVKFQSYRGEDTPPDDPEHDFFMQVALTDDMHLMLKSVADEQKVQFLSSPFTIERARFLIEGINLQSIKIASCKITDLEFLDYINSMHQSVKAVYLSTGMAKLATIDKALIHLKDIQRIAILHCVSVYPTPDEEANLLAIRTLHDSYPNHDIGYSDHTRGIAACVAAVALGATVLEKHYTFNTLMPGTDHEGAMTPQSLEEMVQWIERIERMLGTGEKVPSKGEEKIMSTMLDRFSE